MLVTEIELDNCLVKQKNMILNLCNQGDWEAAFSALEIVGELWIAAGYEYKLNEIKKRISDHFTTRQKIGR